MKIYYRFFILQKFQKHNFGFEIYSFSLWFVPKLKDCGIPEIYGVDVDNMQQGDAIALNRRMQVSCAGGFEQSGTGSLNCRSSGEWDYRITCVEKGNSTT